MKIRIIFFSFIIVLGLVASKTYAQTPVCQPAMYGGGQTCVQNNQFTLDKKVKEPDTNAFRDQLTANSNRFTPGQTVIFRLVVKNTSNRNIDRLTVSDTIPAYLTFVQGDGGYNETTNAFTATIDRLDQGQSRTIQIITTIDNDVPRTPSPLCLINTARAALGNTLATDNAMFCIDNSGVAGASTGQQIASTQQGSTRGTVSSTSKGGIQVYTQPNQNATPATGPEMLALVGLIPAGLGGFYLRKKTQ